MFLSAFAFLISLSPVNSASFQVEMDTITHWKVYHYGQLLKTFTAQSEDRMVVIRKKDIHPGDQLEINYIEDVVSSQGTSTVDVRVKREDSWKLITITSMVGFRKRAEIDLTNLLSSTYSEDIPKYRFTYRERGKASILLFELEIR